MSPDDDVSVAARWTAQTARHIIGCRATHPPHVGIEHVARLNPTLVIVIPLVGLSEHRMVPVLVVIIARGFLLLLVELAILLLTLPAVLVTPVLCHSRDAGKSKQRRRTSGHQPSCLHKFPPIKLGISLFNLGRTWVYAPADHSYMTIISEGEGRVSSLRLTG